MALSLPVPFRDRALVRRTVAPAVAEASASAGGPTRVGRVVVKKTGAIGAFLRPIGTAIGIVIVGVVAIFALNIFLPSEARRALHDSAIVEGKTTVQAPVARQGGEGEVEFVIRQGDGHLVRVIAPQDATNAFVNDTLISLDKDRARLHARAVGALDQVFAQAYASRDADLKAYADWFFAWGKSWRLLYEAAVGGVQEAFRLGFSQTQVIDAARHGVEDYLLRHYQEFVLKPGERDPFIVDGVQRVFADANGEFQAVLAGLDDRLQRFVHDKAVFTEP